ncbi:hypothetical protein J7E68_03190, partial [Microbacterium sp. ISL-103]|uniref:deaminase n=1 Tax=Microbacterium sp. ISL-103 TaxID=2819156 RepID=UPI001C187822
MSTSTPREAAPDRDRERRHAQLAIDQALLCRGNARVGVVIARGEDVLATGFKDDSSGRHAEQVALQAAKDAGIDVAGAELYTTLEPCANSRTRRTPCCQLVAEAGIVTVHIGEYDRNPQIYRLGWKNLRDSGVVLRDFPADLREAAQQANADFATVFTEGTGMSAGA